MKNYSRFGPLKELLILGASVVGVYIISSTMESLELIHHLIHEYEWLRVGDLILSVFVLLIGHAIFSSRRWRELERRVDGRTLELRQEVEQRSAAEEAVRGSKDFLEKIIDSIPDPLFVKDSEHRFVLVNAAGCKLAGVKREDFIGKTDYDFFPKEEVDVFWEKDKTVLMTGEEDVNEEEITNSERVRRTVLTKKSLYTDNLGEKFIVGIIRDITDRKLGEAALRESARRFREVLENIHLIAVILERQGNISFCNDYLLGLTGYGRDEVLGRNWFDLFIPYDNREEMNALFFEKVLSGDLPVHYQNEIITKDGKLRLIAWNNTPLRNAQGETIGCTSIGEDITDRVSAERALKESEERYRSLVELSPETIAVHRDGKYLYMNPAGAGLLGASSPSHLIGRSIYDFVAPEYREVVRERIRLSQENGSIAPLLEQKLVRLDGRMIDVEVVAMPIHYMESPAIQVVMRDITGQKQAEQERKKLEAQLRQAQKIEAIGTLAGGIAHDFNNILAAIFGYTEMALLSLPVESPVRDYIKQVLKASRRARDLVKQILVFSRQTSAQERSPIEIKPIIKEAVKLLRAGLPATVEIRQDISGTPSMVLADPTQIHQVLINLCTNAAHAMEQTGGVIEISLKGKDLDQADLEKLPGLKPGSYLELSVRDTGHGMDRATMERIFDPYFTTKETGKGSGLGLAMVHGIVKRHEGAIAVESEPGKGSTFHVFLPGTGTVLDTNTEATAEIPKGKGRILFVDDEELLVDLGKSMLVHLGYEVTGASSSTEALEIFRSNPYQFDLVVTDYTMPKITGDMLAKEMMAIRPDIPIILATGFSERISEEKAKSMGIRELLMKPITIQHLAETVRKVLNTPTAD